MVNANLAQDAVDPRRVPTRALANGDKIPGIGLGTFGSDKYPGEVIAGAVLGAAEIGYRHFDCAAVYGNEYVIGHSLQKIFERDIRRDEIWVTSKLWNDKHNENDVMPAFEKSLRDLQLDYLDLYLIHWPFPNFHAPGVSVASRDPHAQPYIHENFMRTWRQLEKIHKMGLARHIGTSNMTIPKLNLLLRDAEIKPACNEMELHPHFQQPELFQCVVDNGVVPIGYAPIGSPSRPERDRTSGDTVDTQDPVILEIAQRKNISPVAVCLKWGVQRGHVVIPFATKRAQYLANLQAVTSDPLSDDDMRAISAIDKNCRLIKGQVFLWQGARDWQDLWDLDGSITS